MMAIILCAGFGTRLYPLTRDRAKALLPLGGRPILDYLVDQLLDLPGLTAVHVVSNHRFIDQFENWQHEIQPRINAANIRFHLHDDGASSETERLGANGDLAYVLQKIELTADVLIAAGDNVLQFDIRPIWAQFRQNERNLVMAIREDDPERLKRTGVIVLNEEDQLVGFHEKPSEPISPWSCPPFYFLNQVALQALNPFLTRSDLPDAMGHLIAYLIDKVPVYAFKVRGRRLDVGNIDSYQEAKNWYS
jgi:glucose-1-phosphate thymidylyltransferase